MSSKTEFAWVIEHPESEVSRPLYWSPGEPFDWTADNLLAVRFARKEDAARVAEALLPEGEPRIAEHGWG